MSGDQFSRGKIREKDRVGVIQHIQLPQLGTGALRNGVPICRDGFPVSGGGQGAAEVSLTCMLETSRWEWGHMSGHTT